MTILTDPPKDGFRLSQLIYDTRYRSLTIQAVAAILIMVFGGMLIFNAYENLSALGKGFTLEFLGTRSGYDINQRLVEYSSNDTHARAAMVGMMNTLLVAVLGCIFATILGVVFGVLRLSNNWIVQKLATVYVEGFRNVPLLLWIIAIFAITTEAFPAPKDFKEGGTASMYLWDSIAISNRGTYLPEPLFENTLGNFPVRPGGIFSNLYFDVSLDLVALLLLLGAAALVNRLINDRATATQERTGSRPTTWWIKALVYIVPTFALLHYLGFHLGYPELAGLNFKGGTYVRNSLIALWLALSLYTGAFIAEIVRGGINSVYKGQTEAAYALGLRPGKTTRLVVLPQALRVIIPPLISQFLNLTKNSSLAGAIGYMDIRSTLGGITVSQTGRELEGIMFVGVFYLVVSLLISFGMNAVNNRVKLKER